MVDVSIPKISEDKFNMKVLQHIQIVIRFSTNSFEKIWHNEVKAISSQHLADGRIP